MATTSSRGTARQTLIGASGYALYPPGATFGPRTLRDFEFVWILDGTVEWTVDGQTVTAEPGTVLLGRPGQTDQFRWDPQRATRHGFIHFTPADPDGGGAGWPMLQRLPEGDILRPLLHHVCGLAGHEEPAARRQAAGMLDQALAAFRSGLVSTTTATDQPLPTLVEGALAFIATSWDQDGATALTLGDLARATGVSSSHLTRVFRQSLGLPPMTVLRQVRMDRAAHLLAGTNLDIQTIAAQCGFPDAFHFSKVFRAAYGVAPRTFRQRALAGDPPRLNRVMLLRHLGERLWRRPG